MAVSELRIALWTGGDAPNKQVVLHVSPQYDNSFAAYWEPGYCGCEDCHWIVGSGATPALAIEDYWERWSEKYDS